MNQSNWESLPTREMDYEIDQMTKKLSNENYELCDEYNNEMIKLSHSNIARHKNLVHYVKLYKTYGTDFTNFVLEKLWYLILLVIILNSTALVLFGILKQSFHSHLMLLF